MTAIREFFRSSIVFWMAWIIIPLIMEVIPAIVDSFILIKRKLEKRKAAPMEYLPEITLIIPVYNSADSLYRCIESVQNSTYPKNLIYMMLVNNQSTDNSFEIFTRCQKEFSELTMTWIEAKQGKSKALNVALFNSYGKYIIHIDSDGVLHPQAIYNMVRRFEQTLDVDCMTGTIMTNPQMIEETKGFFKRQLRQVEFFEYCQAFLAGRNFQSEFNSIYTLSGAFSAFRKSAILKTQMYNTDTVCEDTHVTFQIRDRLQEKVIICDDAFFFVDPIENMNQLYTQRQRWQKGELEVAHMFLKEKMDAAKGFFSNFVIRLLMYDHTFAFPRMIWYFALICLGFMNYPMKLIVQSVVLIYVLYTVSSFLFFFNILSFLSEYKDLQKYYGKRWYHNFTLPLFNFIVFWFRFAGIINAIRGAQSWKSRNFTEEWKEVCDIVKKDFRGVRRLVQKMKGMVNQDE